MKKRPIKTNGLCPSASPDKNLKNGEFAPKRVKITDTTLRDGHQSLWATRMSTAEMLPIVEKMDKIGYWSLEVWGGATFDVSLRYLNEDPWDRLSELRSHIKNTKLQMLLRGQNIVGYRNYPDDLLEAFIAKAAERGLDIFRIFDALNDTRNLAQAIKLVKKYNKSVQGTLCYTISPIHTVKYYLQKAREQSELGIDSICIKDMAGILSPQQASELVSALKSEFKFPIQLHSHASSGMVVATYLKAIEAGVDSIDTAHAPLAFSFSQPAVETIVAMLEGTNFNPGLNLTLIEEVSEYFEKIRQEKNLVVEKTVDEMVITHQIPGGMASNLLAQLKEQKATERLKEVLEEVPRVRRDLGYPPLVTPTSQIVGVQAVFNVLAGERYKIVPKEVKDYVKGLYGKPPAPIKESIRKKILGNEKPITTRPADLLEPILAKVKAEVPKDLILKEEDYISYALFPEVALKFFNWRKNPQAQKVTANTKEVEVNENEGVKVVKELIELANKNNLAELEWDYGGNKIKIRRITNIVAEPIPEPIRTNATKVEKPSPVEAKPEPVKKYEEIKSPMVGVFYSRPRPDAPPFVEKGDVVDPGQPLCIIEAMKLMNEIEAEKRLKIIEILVEDGESVEYGKPLFLVEPA
uniref:Acetyl-CoA carboxylase biotin carboxyl carrier protein n=1 Tax=candidate division WOR-3 bacterium TaxID=2052148 RepID=A0A7C6AAA6_UNCW3